MTADFVIVQGLNGVAYGLLLFLLAAGLTLIFGMMDVVNLAHGSFFMVGAYIGYSAARATQNFWLALVVAPLAVGVLGVLIEAGLLKRLYRRPLLDQVILTFGLSFMAAELVKIVWGSNELVLRPPDVFAGGIEVLGNAYPVYRLFVIAVGVLVALALLLVERRSRIGAIIRAGVVDRADGGRAGGQYRRRVHRRVRVRRGAGGIRRCDCRPDPQPVPGHGRRRC